MARSSRNYYKNPYTLEVDTVTLFIAVAIGSSGAVSSVKGAGVTGVTKQATAGQYEIALDDQFARFFHVHVVGVDDAPVTFAQAQVLEDPATFQADVKADGKFKIQLLDFAGAAVNAASGTTLLIEIKLRQSSIGRYDA